MCYVSLMPSQNLLGSWLCLTRIPKLWLKPFQSTRFLHLGFWQKLKLTVAKSLSTISEEYFSLLNVNCTTTTLPHPNCSAQFEVFIMIVKKYLASYFDDSTLNCEEFLLALSLSYSRRHPSTIATAKIEIFCVSLCFSSPGIDWVDHGESLTARRIQLLNQAYKSWSSACSSSKMQKMSLTNIRTLSICHMTKILFVWNIYFG